MVHFATMVFFHKTTSSLLWYWNKMCFSYRWHVLLILWEDYFILFNFTNWEIHLNPKFVSKICLSHWWDPVVVQACYLSSLFFPPLLFYIFFMDFFFVRGKKENIARRIYFLQNRKFLIHHKCFLFYVLITYNPHHLAFSLRDQTSNQTFNKLSATIFLSVQGCKQTVNFTHNLSHFLNLGTIHKLYVTLVPV